MLGVVIWTDAAECKAIIWCEDHGELAYLGQHTHSGGLVTFDQGDLIQFDLAEHRSMRLAQNPRKIAHHYCSDLGDVLEKAQTVKTQIEEDRSTHEKRPGALHRKNRCSVIDFAKTRQKMALSR